MNSMALTPMTINKLFFTIKKPRSSKFSLYYTSTFLKGSFATKKLAIKFPKRFAFFFIGCLSSFPINKQSTSFSNILAI
jgi:hypothetical protein